MDACLARESEVPGLIPAAGGFDFSSFIGLKNSRNARKCDLTEGDLRDNCSVAILRRLILFTGLILKTTFSLACKIAFTLV